MQKRSLSLVTRGKSKNTFQSQEGPYQVSRLYAGPRRIWNFLFLPGADAVVSWSKKRVEGQVHTKISLTVLVNGFVLLMLPIYQRATAHERIGYNLLSVNENLRLIGGVKRVVGLGWSLLRWNHQISDLNPSYNHPPFHLWSTHLTNPCLKMGPCFEIEEIGWKYWQFAGNLQGPNWYALLSRLARMLIMCPPTNLKMNLMLETIKLV